MAGILDQLKRRPEWKALRRAFASMPALGRKAIPAVQRQSVSLGPKLGSLLSLTSHDVGKLLRLIVLYLVGAGFADLLLNSIADAYALSISRELLPAFAKQPTYNQGFITYVVMLFFVIGAVILYWVWNYFPKRQLIPPLPPFVLLLLALAGFLAADSTLSAIFFALALVITLLFWRAIAEKKTAPRVRRSFDWLRAAPLFLALGCFGCVAAVASAWYPVKIPSDYYEFADQIYLTQSSLDSFYSPFGKSDKQLSQSQAVACIVKYRIEKQIHELENSLKMSPDEPSEELLQFLTEEVLIKYSCPLPAQGISSAAQSVSAAQSIWSPILGKVGHWEAQSGRLLYHHAYIFVPARHFLTYGFDSGVPYLYGFGNTLFHAALLAIRSPSLTTYFNTLPLAYLFGLIAIALVVLYATGNVLAAFVGFALGIGALFLMDAAVLRLAVGLSPLRYLGLALQIASIFYIFRGDAAKRAFAMPLVLAFSYFWNKEFAVLGAVGQTLALFSPSLALSFLRRFAHVLIFVAAMALIVLVTFVAGPSSDILQNIQLGFFNIAVPVITPTELALFYLGVATMAAILVFAAYQFDPRERAARLCVLAIFALVMIKFLYNPALDNVRYSFVLIAPLLLIYYRWTSGSWKRDAAAKTRRTLESQLSILLVLICYTQADAFRERSILFDQRYIDPFVINRWSPLGENLATPIPGRPIAQRVEAVKSVLRPGDQVLLLSPFDHLISFYANPARYCGHFELLTNLVTVANMDSVLRCARASERLLVIYDKALEIGCPEDELGAFFHRPSCLSKYELKTSLRQIMRNLEPEVTLVGEIGDLKFYRRSRQAGGS